MSNPIIEIHHVSVSAGDATIIAVRKSDSDENFSQLLLIDAGKSEADLKIIETYCSAHLMPKYFSYVILSHSHDDHHGALPECDLFGSSTTLIYSKALKNIFKSTSISKFDKIDFNTTKNPYSISIENGTLKSYCAGGVLCNGSVINNSYKDENDLSIAWVLEYNGFVYFTAGDLSGENISNYKNLEKSLVDYLFGSGGPLENKKVNVLKATHHGSKHSLFGYDNKSSEFDREDSYVLDKMRPKVIVVPCNNSITPPLPTPQLFLRAKKYGVDRVFLVNEFHRDASKDLSKYLEIDINYWKDKTNIFPKDGYDENTRYVNTNAIDKLPSLVVKVQTNGKWIIENNCNVPYDSSTKNAKINKTVLKSIPDTIPHVYFTQISSEKNESYFEKILSAGSLGTDSIKAIYDLYNTKSGKLVPSPELKSIKLLRDFDQRYNLFTHFSNLPAITRYNDKKAVNYILKYIDSFIRIDPNKIKKSHKMGQTEIMKKFKYLSKTNPNIKQIKL